jgi:hypothetical protein
MFPHCGILCFDLFNSFHYSPLPFYLPPPFSTALNTHPYILCLHRCYVLYYWCSIILFAFSSFPEFHTVVPLSQTYFIHKFAYGHACFCIYVYLLDLSSKYERNHMAFVFLSLIYFIQHEVLQIDKTKNISEYNNKCMYTCLLIFKYAIIHIYIKLEHDFKLFSPTSLHWLMNHSRFFL